MNSDTPRINLVGYFTAFMAALSLLSLISAAPLAAPTTITYLQPLLLLVALLFLALTVLVLSRWTLAGARRWNTPQAEENLLFTGLLVACGMGVLALASYGLAAIGATQAAMWLTKSWAAIYAICFGALACYSRPARRGGFMAITAMFLTIAIFGIFF